MQDERKGSNIESTTKSANETGKKKSGCGCCCKKEEEEEGKGAVAGDI